MQCFTAAEGLAAISLLDNLAHETSSIIKEVIMEQLNGVGPQHRGPGKIWWEPAPKVLATDSVRGFEYLWEFWWNTEVGPPSNASFYNRMFSAECTLE